MARRLIGTAVTDTNGEATITYTGTGAGKLNIVAESGTFQSDSYELIDAIVYDECIENTYDLQKWFNSSNVIQVSHSNNGRKLTSTTSGGYYYIAPNGERSAAACRLFNTWCMEFDLTQIEFVQNSSKHIAIRFNDGTQDVSIRLDIGMGLEGTSGHFKIWFDGTLVHWTIDDGEEKTLSGSSAQSMNNIGTHSICFVLPNETGYSMTYKNFFIYPI